MSEKLTIVHQKQSIGFAKTQPVTYDGVKFDNGKIAYLDENGDVCVYNKQEMLENDLAKQGKVTIQSEQQQS